LIRPALVILSAAIAEHATNAQTGLNDVARHAPLARAGAGASAATARIVGARFLGEDPVTAAATVAAVS
jgi:hypothetical protein